MTQARRAKFVFVGAVRALGLLKLADTVKFLLGQARAWPANRRFRARHPGFATPPRHLAFDAFNHCDWERYRDTGLKHARLFARVIHEQLPAGAPLDVLEWGCGPGRLVRHMEDLLPGRKVALTGADYNAETVAWCRRSLPRITFVENGLNPPLPFADAQFDAIYSYSVLTHLSEDVQVAWVNELRRVLKPGGLLVCTTHGEAHRYLLSTHAEQAAFDAGRLVVQGKYQEGKKWFLSIHPESYVRDRLLADFTEVCRSPSRPDDDMLQDVWTARRREAAQ